MAKLPASNTRVYLDQYNISGDLNGWNQEVEQQTPEVTALSDSGPRRVVDNYDHRDGYLGFFDGVDDDIDEIVHALLGSATDHYYGKVIASSFSNGLPAEGSVAYESILHLTEKPLSGQVGGAVLLNFNGAGTGGIFRGVVLRSATLTGAGNGTGQNLGATTAGQEFAVVFRVLSFTGTSLTLSVEQSTDNGSTDAYASITGLSATFTGIGVSRKSTTAATEAWKRVAATGTFSSALVLVTCGVVKGT